MSKRILIADDNEEDKKLIREMLQQVGGNYEIIFASDGMEALTLARNEKFDCIILDVMLPKIDGFKVCRMLKFDKNHSHVPVIFLTMMIGDYGEKLSKEVGADAFLKKPLDPVRLNDTIINVTSETPDEAQKNTDADQDGDDE